MHTTAGHGADGGGVLWKVVNVDNTGRKREKKTAAAYNSNNN